MGTSMLLIAGLEQASRRFSGQVRFLLPVLHVIGIGRMSPRFRFVSFVSGLAKTMRLCCAGFDRIDVLFTPVFTPAFFQPRKMRESLAAQRSVAKASALPPKAD